MQPVLLWRLLILPSAMAMTISDFWLPSFSIPDNPNCISDGYSTFVCYESQPPCPSMKKHYDLRGKQFDDERNFLVFGHNGLRNRLAHKLDTCDMLYMMWDNSLAELANRHHRFCEKLRDDDEKPKSPRGETGVMARNNFFSTNIYLHNFIEFAVGKWYRKHQKLKPPTVIKIKNDMYYRIIGDNSFTHMVYPDSYRIGCSYAHFTDGVSLICYYYPHVHFNGSIDLRQRPEEYQCPYNFPLPDVVFPYTCRYARYKLEN